MTRARPIDVAREADVLVVPGGRGARQALRDPSILEAVRAGAAQAEVVLSVCTGALILAEAGLLDGLTVTTHHTALDDLADRAPAARVTGDERYVDNGHIVTAAGVSAGIDAALHVVARLCDHAHATATAVHMEYDGGPSTKTPTASGAARW